LNGLPYRSVIVDEPQDMSVQAFKLISRLNLKVKDQPILDTFAIPKRVFPGLNSCSLENLARSLRIESDSFHRALPDASVCMAIFLKCLGKMGGIDQLILEDILAVNGPALDFSPAEITL